MANLQTSISELWNTVSLLNLLSKVNPKDAKAGEFQDSLELIAKALSNTANKLQEIEDTQGGQ